MPETGVLIAEFAGSLGAAEGGVAALGADAALTETITGVAGGLGAAEAGAGAFGAGAFSDMGVSGATDALGEAGGFGGLSSADAASLFGPQGYGGGAGGGGGFDLSSIFGQGGDWLKGAFGKGGKGVGILQLLSGLYGLQQSNKLGKLATQPNVMGEQAVQRSMAAQGYQGSGNMMAALSQYGINGSQAAAQAGMSPLVGSLSSLGLLTGGLQSTFKPGG